MKDSRLERSGVQSSVFEGANASGSYKAEHTAVANASASAGAAGAVGLQQTKMDDMSTAE